MNTDRVRKLISRTIDGVEALVNTESGEIFIDIPAETPRYIRVDEGDTIQEGDARSRTKEELESTSLRKWTVERIGSKTVDGTDQQTGERHEWERESLETKLAVGGVSTNLTNFDRMNVISGAKTVDNEGRTGEGSLTVVLYGNDGQKFTQTYRVIGEGAGGDERYVELTESEKHVETFDPDLRERFDQAVEHALRTEGYAV